jgi:uncharacterized RDD family membrane protein YckC
MPNFQRSTWVTVAILATLALFAVVLTSTLLSPLKPAAGQAGTANSQQGTTPQPLVGPAMVLPPSSARFPIFAAGDEKTLWVSHPILVEIPNKKSVPAFELLARSNVNNTWTLIRDAKGNPNFTSYPRGMAAVSPPAGSKAHASAYVMLERGALQVFSLNDNTFRDSLPPDHALLATTGTTGGVFAITAGAPHPSTTRPGDRLNLQRPIPQSRGLGIDPATTAPATSAAATTTRPATTAAATRPTIAPATVAAASGPATTSQPATPATLNAFWFHDSRWTMLPTLGSQVASPTTPGPEALMAIAHQGERLALFWVEPTAPQTLNARSLNYKDTQTGWSQPVTTQLPSPVPAQSRLLPIVLDETLHLFWPTPGSSGAGLELQGGRLVVDPVNPKTDLTLPEGNMLPAMSLATAGDGLNPATDVAIAPSENSIAVLVNNKTNNLQLFVFNNRGQLYGGPTPVEPQTPRRDVLFAQNIAVMLLVLMLTLSFWQWRQRPGPLKLPTGMTIASTLTRSLAFAIDMAIPYVIVCTVYALWGSDGYKTLLATGRNAILHFEVLFNSPALMMWLGLYLLHVTVGELFFRRSIGKALTGLEVLMIDSKPPTVGAVLVRNLIRLPEILLGIIVIYVFVSPNRQRLGDLLGKTVVISHKPPSSDTPE